MSCFLVLFQHFLRLFTDFPPKHFRLEHLDAAAKARKAAEDAKRELAKARYELEVAQGQQRAAEDAVRVDTSSLNFEESAAVLAGLVIDRLSPKQE